MHLLPIAEPLRQIPPGNAGPIAVQHCLNEQPIVLGGDADMSFTPRQHVLDTIPLVVAQAVAAHGSALRIRLTLHESERVHLGNPLIEDTP